MGKLLRKTPEFVPPDVVNVIAAGLQVTCAVAFGLHTLPCCKLHAGRNEL